MFKKIFVFAVVLLGIQACDIPAQDVDEQQRQATEEMVSEANRQIGMPDIVNYTERRFARDILELRDTEIATYTYIVDMNGNLHFVCESVGYGLPYAVQYTNPEREERAYNGSVTLPQPDPNGLFMPSGAAATWILCADGDEGVSPVYSEPELIVTTFPLNSASSYRD